MKKQLPETASPLAKRIFDRMTGLGLTQKRLALDAGLNETYVRDVFKGSTPSSDNLTKLAAVLRCSVAALLGIEPMPANPGVQNLEAQEGAEIVRLWESLTRKEKIIIERLIESFLDFRNVD